MVGAVGRDDFGEALLANLDRAGVDRTGVAILPGAGSGMSVAIFDDDGDYGAVIVSGSNLAILAGPMRRRVPARRRPCWCCRTKCPKPSTGPPPARRDVSGSRRSSRRSGPRIPDRPAGLVDILVVNAIEAEMLGGGRVGSAGEALTAARALTAQFAAVLVTAGGEGVAYADRSGAEHVVPAAPVVVASTHGAGDMFVGTLATELGRGMPLLEGIRAANQAAARLVSTPEADR